MLVHRKVAEVGLLLAVICAGAGCDKKTTAPPTACSITDAAFGNVTVGFSKDLTVTLTNGGTKHLAGALAVLGPGGGFELVGSDVFALDPGQSATFTVRFQPFTVGDYVGGAIASHGLCQATFTGAGVADSATWTSITPAGTPPSPRAFHSVIFDPVRDRLVVFGGNDGTPASPHLLNDLWELSLTGTPTWTQLKPAGMPPSSRATHSAIYDAGMDRLIVFGGFDGTNRLGDVWTLSLAGGLTWTQLNPSGALAARGLHTAIYDPTGARMVVFGGLSQAGNYLNDVQALSLTGAPTWTPLTPSGTPPGVRASHAAIHDALRHRMIVSGGYGGDGLDKNDVWALSLTATPAWTLLATAAPPPRPRQGHSVVYEAVADRMILFGGYNDGVRAFYGDVWYLTLGTPMWSTPTIGGTPPGARRSHTAINDPVRHRMIVFGGNDLFGPSNAVWVLED